MRIKETIFNNNKPLHEHPAKLSISITLQLDVLGITERNISHLSLLFEVIFGKKETIY